MTNNDDVHQLFYLRQAPEKEWAAELCFRGKDNVYHSVLISDNQLLNFVEEAAKIVRQRGLLNLGDGNA